MNRINWIVFFVVLLMIFSQDVTGRRGRGRGRSKSRVNFFALDQLVSESLSFVNLLLFRSFRSGANWFTNHRQIQRSRIRSVLQQQQRNYIRHENMNQNYFINHFRHI